MSEKPLCYYPFNQMLLQPNGDISPCCWNQSVKWGNIKDQSLTEIWNGPAAVAFREEFIQKNHKSCETQINQIGCHLWSHREFADQIEFSAIKNESPQRFDVRLNGKCNLECVMCDVWSQPNGLYNGSDFWTKGPTHFFPYLKEIDVLGGEPFIQADTYRLIEEISKVNLDCRWSFVTNAQYKFNAFLKSNLDRIQIRWLQVSMDSLNESTYVSIRKKGKFKMMMETLFAYIQYRDQRAKESRGFTLNASICVQPQNWMELEDFLIFCETNNLGPILQFAFGPEHLSILSLGHEERLKIYNYVHGLQKQYGDILSPILLPLKNSIQAQAVSLEASIGI